MDNINVKINNRNPINIALFFHITIMLIPVIFWVFGLIQTPLFNNEYNLIILYGNFTFLWCIFSWWYVTKSIFNPYIIFLSSLFIFTFGQSFLKGFGIEAYPNLNSTYSLSEIQLAEIFTILCICFFHLGSLISLHIKRNTLLTPFIVNKDDESLLSKGIFITGIILFCLSIFPSFSYKIQWLRYSNLYGYKQAFTYVGQESSVLSNILSQFFIPSIFLLIVGGSKSKSIRMLVITVTIIWSIIGFAAGDRGEQLSFIIPLLWLWKSVVSRKQKVGPGMIILGIIIINLIPAFTAFRNITNRDINIVLEKISEAYTNKNPIVTTVNELGYSMMSLIEVMNLMPSNFEFRHGESYFNAFLKLLPSFLESDFISYRNSLSFWLQDVLNLSYGPGFSMPAEAYYNFGWFGPIIFIFFGIIYGVLFKIQKDENNSNLLEYVFVASVLNITIMNTRESFINVPITIFNYAFIPVILAYIIFKYLKRFA